MKREKDGLFKQKISEVDLHFQCLSEAQGKAKARVKCIHCNEQRDRCIPRMLTHLLNCKQGVSIITNEDTIKIKEEIIKQILKKKPSEKVDRSLLSYFPYNVPDQNTQEYLNIL